MANLDEHLDESILDDEHNLPVEGKIKIPRPILDGEFIIIQLNKNPARTINI